MDGPAPHDPIDDPVDPKLEELLRQELAVPPESQERTMKGLALRLKDFPRMRTATRPRTKNGGWPRVLAAAVMLALMLGLFALLELTKRPGTHVSPPTDTSLAGSNQHDKKDPKDEERPAPAVETDPPLTAADLPKLIHGVEAGNPSERIIGTRRLTHGGLLAKDALEHEFLVLTRAGNKTEELKHVNELLDALRKEEDSEVQRVFALLDSEPSDKPLYAAANPTIAEKLQRKVTFDFVDTPMEEALGFMTQVTGVRVALDPNIKTTELPKINLRVTDMSSDLAIDWTANLAGLVRVNRSNVILVTTNARAHRLMLQKQALQLGTSGDDAPWTLDETKEICNLMPQGLARAEDAGVIAALAEPAQFAEIELAVKTFVNPRLRPVGAPEWTGDTDRKLERKVTFEFVDQTVEDGLNFLNSLAKVNIIIDPKAVPNGKRTFDLQVTGLSLSDSLARVCEKSGLAATYRNQAIFLTLRPAELDSRLCVFDLRPALKAGVPLTVLSMLLEWTIADAPVKNRRAALIRSRLCANIDPWTAGRINTILDEAAKTGKLPAPPPVPWFFQTLRDTPPRADVTPPAPRQEQAPRPQVQTPKAPAPEKKRDEF